MNDKEVRQVTFLLAVRMKAKLISQVRLGVASGPIILILV